MDGCCECMYNKVTSHAFKILRSGFLRPLLSDVTCSHNNGQHTRIAIETGLYDMGSSKECVSLVVLGPVQVLGVWQRGLCDGDTLTFTGWRRDAMRSSQPYPAWILYASLDIICQPGYYLPAWILSLPV